VPRAPRPLGRSLTPLPGESLPGYLLRLSCRLNLAPARLAGLAGLPASDAGTLPATLVAGVPGPARETFALVTRLTQAQVAGLGMDCWQDRYPLPARSPGAGLARSPMDRWALLAPATRYCPQCLAGDGTLVQESLGGPWLKVWHLPVVFACPVHQRLLEDLCPGCGQAVRGRRTPCSSPGLLPAARQSGLHPAQCRAGPVPDPGGRGSSPACCGARLDRPGTRRPVGRAELALQGKILRLLDPDGPGSADSAGLPALPAAYFADLRALALLAASTWPAARYLSPSEDAAQAIDRHAACAWQPAAEPGTDARSLKRSAGGPPLDAAVSAGLAAIAESILVGTAEEACGHLAQLLPPSPRLAGRTSWARWVTESSACCSPGLQAAYQPLLRTFTRERWRGRRDPIICGKRWGPQNVPALIPDEWHARHFTPIDEVSPLLARRTASLSLVQMTAGGSLDEAAQFLGMSPSYGKFRRPVRASSFAGAVHSAASRQSGPRSFEAGLTSLAGELSDPATPLVDYQRRRQALEAWSIGEDAWADITSRLPPATVPRSPATADGKRQVASVYVWTRVTCGEPGFAPRPIEAARQPPRSRENQQMSFHATWRNLQKGPARPGTHYALLRAELDALATALAASIDAKPGAWRV